MKNATDGSSSLALKDGEGPMVPFLNAAKLFSVATASPMNMGKEGMPSLRMGDSGASPFRTLLRQKAGDAREASRGENDLDPWPDKRIPLKSRPWP